jgi:hypothetical protein
MFNVRSDPNPADKSLVVLIRISNIYTTPQIEFLNDLWSIYTASHFKFSAGWVVKFPAELSAEVSNLAAVSKRRLPTIRGRASLREVQSTQETATRVPCSHKAQLNSMYPTLAASPRTLGTTAGMADDRQQYTYQRLQDHHVRLFILYPRRADDDALRGMICTVPFQHAGSYRTLSYVWGPDSQPIRSLITPDGTLSIRSSLSAALRHLRNEIHEEILWVDAICINQADELEKRQQIRLLPHIFQNASCTVAFLGDDDESHDALEALIWIRARSLYGSEAEGWPEGLAPVPCSWGRSSMPKPDDPIWSKIVALFNRAWFRRAWIVQEVVAAPSVKIACGAWTVDWNDLHGALELVSRRLQAPGIDASAWAPFLTLGRMREWEARDCRWSLSLLLETFRHVQSSLRRDRIFSLVGLACDGDDAAFEPDYTSSFEEISCRVARAFVAQGRGMQLLHRAGIGAQPSLTPSWVPDWSVERSRGLNDSRDRGVIYDASAGLEAEIECDPDTDILSVQGFIVDEIEQVTKSTNRPKQWKQYFREIDAMVESLRPYHEQVALNTFRGRVPVAGALHPKVATGVAPDLYESWKSFQKILKKAEFKGAKEKRYLQDLSRGIAAAVPGEEKTLLDKSMNYISLLKDSIAGWRYVVTKRKRCGIAPAMVQAGDRVGIINGGDVPFILRKSQETEGTYQLIGGSYVDELMDGEGVEQDGVVQETIRIR